MNARHKATLATLAVLFAAASALLFQIFYQTARNTAVEKLNEQQRIHARQAARGIEDFFAMWTRSLESLSKMDEIIDNDAVGRRNMEIFHQAHHDQIREITRLNEKGVISYNFPSSQFMGADISDQKHVRLLLRDHKPVISDIFAVVEGGDAIAIHVPIFRGAEFKGSIGILIDFQSLAKRHLDAIKIGETGYAWVLSRDGTILYSPIQELVGASVLEGIRKYPTIETMVKSMLRGEEGSATYNYDRVFDRHVGPTRKYAVYMPVRIGNTFWSIAVSSAEQDVLSGLISFRNKLILVIGAMFICGMVFTTLGAKAWFIVKEEEKRKQVERELLAQREELTHLSRVTVLGELTNSLAHELSQPLTAMHSNIHAGRRNLNSANPDLTELAAIFDDLDADANRARDIIHGMRAMLRKEAPADAPLLDLNDVVNKTLHLLRGEIIGRKQEVSLHLAAALPPVRAVRVEVKQVLINLVINALDAMKAAPGRGPLEIATARRDNTVTITVRDTGPGIPQEIMPRIFDPFFSTKPGGLGLGLSISRHIMERFGGKLQAENHPDGGAVFRMILPVDFPPL